MSAMQKYWCDHHTVSERTGFGEEHVSCRRLTCADGFNVSVQASAFHYCAPRTYMPDGSYSAWELGFPTAADDLIQQYAEDPADPLGTVYGYVPTEVVDALIAKHGGIAARSKGDA